MSAAQPWAQHRYKINSIWKKKDSKRTLAVFYLVTLGEEKGFCGIVAF